MTQAASTQPPLTFWHKLSFGIGAVAYGIKDHGFGAFLLLYYNQVLGLPASWVGNALAGALIVDALLDPIIGHVSDHWRSRFGRRHPFMYFSALPVAVAYVMLWNPPTGLSQAQTIVYLIAITVMVRTFISMYEVPSAALIPELTPDYNGRTSLISYRFFFAYGSTVLIGLIALKIFMQPTAAYPVGQLNPAGYVPYSYACGAFMFVAIIIAALGTQRYVMRNPVAPPAPTGKPFNLAHTLREARDTLGNRGVMPLLGAGMFGGLASYVASALQVYIYTFFWELNADQLGTLSIPSVIAAIFGMLLATRISTVYGKRNTSIGMSCFGLVLMSAPLILRLIGWFPENGSPVLVPILFAVACISTSCAIIGGIMWFSMTTDVVEDSQLRTGRRSEGLLFATTAFINKSVSGLGLAVGGWVLDLVAFPQQAVPGLVEQPVLTRLVVVKMVIAGLLYLIALACTASFPITAATHRDNVEKLARRTAAEPAA